MSALIVAPDSAALTPARAELARVNALIAAVAAERDEAQALVDRWRGPESEMATIELQIAQLRAQRDSDRAAWSDRGCLGDPPVDPPVWAAFLRSFLQRAHPVDDTGEQRMDCAQLVEYCALAAVDPP